MATATSVLRYDNKLNIVQIYLITKMGKILQPYNNCYANYDNTLKMRMDII